MPWSGSAADGFAHMVLDTIVLLYMLIFLVADCVCGVVGTSFLVVVGQHEDSWVGSILHHI